MNKPEPVALHQALREGQEDAGASLRFLEKPKRAPTQRRLGAVLAVFALAWLTSGLFIACAGPASVSAGEQLQNRELLGLHDDLLSLGEAWTRSARQLGQLAAVTQARLVREGGHPLWLVEDTRGQRVALSAIDGTLHLATPEDAVQIAARWVAHGDGLDALPTNDTSPVIYLGNAEQDGSVRLDALRPFHRVGVGNGGRELLISERTGEVVRDSTALTRILYGAGNWLWSLSGAIHSNPWQLFSPAQATHEALARSKGSSLPQAMRDWHPAALEAADDQQQIVELVWQSHGDETVLIGLTRDGKHLPQSAADTGRPAQAAAPLPARGPHAFSSFTDPAAPETHLA